MKTVPTDQPVDQFLAGRDLPERRREDSAALLDMMRRITGEEPVLWGASIIGFGSYRYKYETGREGVMCATGFSPQKARLSLYLMGCMYQDDPLFKKLGKHKRGAGCLYINKLDDVDLTVLEEIITKAYRSVLEKYPRAN